jgi:hypothetical protein
MLLVCLTLLDAGLTLFCAGFEGLVLSVGLCECSLQRGGVMWGTWGTDTSCVKRRACESIEWPSSTPTHPHT